MEYVISLLINSLFNSLFIYLLRDSILSASGLQNTAILNYNAHSKCVLNKLLAEAASEYNLPHTKLFFPSFFIKKSVAQLICIDAKLFIYF